MVLYVVGLLLLNCEHYTIACIDLKSLWKITEKMKEGEKQLTAYKMQNFTVPIKPFDDVCIISLAQYLNFTILF